MRQISRQGRRPFRRCAGSAAIALIVVLLTSCGLPFGGSGEANAESNGYPNPSGERIPRGDLAGWRQIFSDDFNGSDLGISWSRHSGQPGGDPYSEWSPSQVSTTGGSLVLRSDEVDGRTVTGGVSNWPVAQQYGKWLVRFRADASDDVTFHFLLWPKNEIWPPEIDFAENFGGDRQQVDAFVHWVDAKSGNQKKQQTVAADFTQWNTVGVEWVPGEIRYTLNGQVWGTETGDRVPSTPMWLGLQAQAGGCQKAAANGLSGCPWVGSPKTTNIEIDWVSVYALQ